MSFQKGNLKRTRPQKHQNATKFSNTRNDKTPKMRMLNEMKMTSLCSKCEAVISWKIQYKKYKPLSVPGHCNKCEKRNVKAAYHHVCEECCEKLEICAKCTEHLEKKAEVEEE